MNSECSHELRIQYLSLNFTFKIKVVLKELCVYDKNSRLLKMTELFLFDAHTVLFPQPSEFCLSIPAKHLRCEWTDF